jgi:UDP-N-acetylmuramyl-tripeptide synthetase
MSAMATRFFDDPSRRTRLVGITGTNGKTTTTYLLESIWRAAGRTPGVIGTINYRIGHREWPAPFTTPQAIELQRLLAEMAAAGATDVAMEVSSHSLALDRVRDCEWDGAVFTNLTRDHLDFHPDMESYFEAKARLFTELMPASQKTDRFAVVNRDDPYGMRLIERVRERVVTFGRSEEADVRPGDVHRTLGGLHGDIRIRSERMAVSSSLVGEAHLDNILAATAVGFAQGIPFGTIADGIGSCAGVPGRMERVDDGRPFAVFVDYAHTPDALERAIRTLRRLTDGRVIVVFGCGGDRDRGKRPVMGEIAGRLGDVVILTSDNPRSEDPLKILHEIEGGVRETGLDTVREAGARADAATGYLVEPDRRSAIRLATSIARPNDAVLIAGKGHEPYQQIGDEKHPFDDRDEARRSLAREVHA